MKRFLALLIVFSLFALSLHAGVTGSVSLANSRLSLVNGTAFVDFSAAATLTPYLNGKLTLTDSAGKTAIGYIKSAGTGETYGNEILADTTFDSDATWIKSHAEVTVSGGKGRATNTTATRYIYQTNIDTTPDGKLFKYGMTIDSITGRAILYHGAAPGAYKTSAATYTYYQTGISGGSPNGGIQFNNTTSAVIDNVSIKQTLSPSPTGVTITSTPGGTTQNWASIEAGFNYNDSSGYTYTIIPRFVGGGLGLGIMYGF